jgi:mono/diheme cytochrome c family protein
MRRFLFWVLAIVLLASVVGLALVRGSGISADRKPWPLEERLAKSGWRFLIPTDVRNSENPVPASPEAIRAGLEHFADHCASCHANDGSGDALIGRRVFPPAPDLRRATTQSLSDGELFYAIEQGIPWTAMPAWKTGTPEGEQDSWKLVRFIRHLPQITPKELKDMEQLNPRPQKHHK